MENIHDIQDSSDILSEVLTNYRENEWCRKNGESYQNEKDFIESELEKFILFRREDFELLKTKIWNAACETQIQECKDTMNDEYTYEFKKAEFKL